MVDVPHDVRPRHPPCRGGTSWVTFDVQKIEEKVSWRYVVEYHVVEACRGDFGMSWRTPRVSWERTHVVEDTMGVVDNDDHVVEVCRGECVSWRCVVGPNVGCRGDEGTSSFSDHVVEVCRGEHVVDVCRGCVSWRCVVGTMSWICVVEVCRGDDIEGTI